jgi:CO dehydrogenase/acetyl-CoA synthase epsilon subunit
MSDTRSSLFNVARDDVLADMISRARQRIMVVAPALTQAVAEALVAKLDAHRAPTIDLILDADPEVYRLG